MKAIIQTDSDNPRSLEWQETERPQLNEGEVLVKVAAAGVNRGDIVQAHGNYPPPPGASEIIGLECAGTIVDAGDTDRSVGEEVGCLLAGGGYGEYVAVPAGQLLPVPKGYSLKETAAVVEVACTVWSTLGMIGGLREGQRVLIHGGGGGIGTMAIQIAKAFGAEVAVTAGSEEKLATCRELGADILINYREQNFVDELKGTCDLILDIIGADYFEDNMKSLAKDGHLIVIAVQSGPKAQINLGRMMPRRQSITAATLRARDLEDKANIVASTVANVWPLLDDGRVTHRIHTTIPMPEAARAHELLDSGEVTGKVVLEVPQD
ncbi:NAD(P)H-quinone oxidoreductase [Corynebacterium yudongzhengii]|uniref:NAD(P)H-quinone oxidoreductase n=1 Tax=Corynebacterium yudongzhengii TaxID=2080740 RepID=A0A2U1T5J0_9CORY|nr:NAD(P)H-quinone oxidoreductase [Corynebacterium yudongzhengii]AWB81032.1 NAD(P)H-quinone oxidoreductase [Corynebacterium yudongzhengii]PWC01277.1 NAD(P)H-quinone oxidoreductase [Corynebacterium yudongzhengii]